MSGAFRLLRDYGIAILAAIVIAVLVRSFVLESYRVPTAVMAPTLLAGDLILVNKWSYSGEKPNPLQYGDVIVFSPVEKEERSYIKRVVGLPGDEVAIAEGRVVLNGSVLDFTPQQSKNCGNENHPKATYRICLEPPLTRFKASQVPEGSVFVIGDLRKQNASHLPAGIIHQSTIQGSVMMIWLSMNPNAQGWIPHFRFDRMFRQIPGIAITGSALKTAQ